METIHFPGISYHSAIEIGVKLISSMHDDLHSLLRAVRKSVNA